jgi:rhamnose utilization protein RhaD (predicted bifunctional aldolase and dehydrogenase)
MTSDLQDLITLAHDLGAEERRLAILGEGNVSTRLSPQQYAVKASGAQLGALRKEDVTVCDLAKTLRLLELKNSTDQQIESALMDARVEGKGRKPSVEAVFHAWLLTLEAVNYVGHCHPVAANQVLCSPRARDFAERRLFPDEVVCCGPASVFVPYVDPGVPLAREIRERTNMFIQQHNSVPRLIVLQNHGLIALGSKPSAVLACMLMAAKAAEIFVGAAALGGPNFMTPQAIERIASRPDEAYRQQQLKI